MKQNTDKGVQMGTLRFWIKVRQTNREEGLQIPQPTANFGVTKFLTPAVNEFVKPERIIVDIVKQVSAGVMNMLSMLSKS